MSGLAWTARTIRRIATVLAIGLVATSCSSSPDSEEVSELELQPGQASFIGEAELSSLEQAFLAYVACLEPQLDGLIRVNFERYLGLQFRFEIPDGADPQIAEGIALECEVSSKLDERLTAFSSTFIPPRAMIEAVVSDVSQCFVAQSVPVPLEVSEASTPESILMLLASIEVLEQAPDAEAVFTCMNAAIYGDETAF